MLGNLMSLTLQTPSSDSGGRTKISEVSHVCSTSYVAVTSKPKWPTLQVQRILSTDVSLSVPTTTCAQDNVTHTRALIRIELLRPCTVGDKRIPDSAVLFQSKPPQGPFHQSTFLSCARHLKLPQILISIFTSHHAIHPRFQESLCPNGQVAHSILHGQ